MKKKKKFFYFIPVIVIAIAGLLSAVVMLLWNGVVIEIFDVKRISYAQATGLFVLCKILFSSFRPGPFRRGGSLWQDKLMGLSPEEREQFRQEWKKRASGDGTKC